MATFYCRMGGALPGGEQFATGVHVSGAGAAADVLTDFASAVTDLWQGNGTTVDGIQGYYSSGVKASSLVVYELNAATGKAVARAELSVNRGGNAVDTDLPTEIAVVASLRSATPGPAGRGRMYLPSPVAGVLTAGGRLDSTVQQGYADSVALFLGDLLTASWQPVLFTPAAADRNIVSVDVGDVFDAQRRRRNKLVEFRVSNAL